MIAIGCDHAGFELKHEVICYFNALDYDYKSYGCYSLESVDYPDIACEVAESIINGVCSKGILICGTGIGMSIVANKFKGIRAANCTDVYMAKMSRLHNNSNILVLGSRILNSDLAIDILDEWLNSEYMGERHSKRLLKIKRIEDDIYV